VAAQLTEAGDRSAMPSSLDTQRFAYGQPAKLDMALPCPAATSHEQGGGDGQAARPWRPKGDWEDSLGLAGNRPRGPISRDSFGPWCAEELCRRPLGLILIYEQAIVRT
jgi:hypothetical protein